MSKLFKGFFVVLIIGAAFIVGSWLSNKYLSQKNLTAPGNLNASESPPDKTKITDVEIIEDIGNRVNFTENVIYFDGQMSVFVISPVYQFALLQEKEVKPGISETVWEFEVSGLKKKFKTLSAKCTVPDQTGYEFKLGQINIKPGELVSPGFMGLTGRLGINVYSGTDKDETVCKDVWSKLKFSLNTPKDVQDFFTQGIVAKDWMVGNDGIIDLSDRITLSQAGVYED